MLFRSSPELISVQSPRHGAFQYVWIGSTGSTLSIGGMLFLPQPLPPHGLNYAYIVTFNPERLDQDFSGRCRADHHAEKQLVGWIEMQPTEWQVQIGTVLISNRSRRLGRGYSPCTSCCGDLANFLVGLRARLSAFGHYIYHLTSA